MSVLQQTVSLAAQLRAFSSLLSLPSQAQSVIKAFVGKVSALPMCLILPAFSSPDLKAFPLHLRHYRSSGSAPSLPNLPRACRARLCLPCQPSSSRLFAPPYRRQTLQPQTRHPSHQRWFVLLLSDCQCQWRKDPHLTYQPHPSATCRGLRPCLLWHLWPVSASAYADAKTVPKHHRPAHFRPLERHCFLDRHLPPEGMYLDYINSKGMHLTAIASRCFYCVGNVL